MSGFARSPTGYGTMDAVIVLCFPFTLGATIVPAVFCGALIGWLRGFAASHSWLHKIMTLAAFAIGGAAGFLSVVIAMFYDGYVAPGGQGLTLHDGLKGWHILGILLVAPGGLAGIVVNNRLERDSELYQNRLLRNQGKPEDERDRSESE